MRKFSLFAMAAVLFGSAALTWADPPAGQGAGIGISSSTVRRAVDSRAGLQQRAGVRAQGSANTGVGVGVGGNGQNSASGNVGIGASLEADLNGSASAQTGTGRLPREVVVRRLQALRSQQSAAVRAASRTEAGLGLGINSRTEDGPQSSPQNEPKNKPPRGKSGRGTDANDASDESNRGGLLLLNGSARSEIVAHGQNRLALTNSEKILAQRLAKIDQMRDQALETDNEAQLDQADRLELLARMQYAERLAAEGNAPPADAGIGSQSEATGTVRGRINRATGNTPGSGAPNDGATDDPAAGNSGRISSDAAAEAQGNVRSRVNNASRRSTDRARRETESGESTGNVRSASFRGAANSSNAANAAAGNGSLNAAGSSATNAAANAQSK